jgi:hypothetical protein
MWTVHFPLVNGSVQGIRQTIESLEPAESGSGRYIPCSQNLSCRPWERAGGVTYADASAQPYPEESAEQADERYDGVNNHDF